MKCPRPSSLFLGFLVNIFLCEVIITNHTVAGTEVFLNFNLDQFTQVSFDPWSIEAYLNSSSTIECGVNCANNQVCVAFYFLKSLMKLFSKDYYLYHYDSDKLVTPEPVSPKDESGSVNNYNYLNCLLLTDRLTSSRITSGIGVYGSVDKILKLSNNTDGRGISPPQMPSAEYLHMTKTKYGPVAVYSCPGAQFFTTFAWLYDSFANNWPSFTMTEHVNFIFSGTSFCRFHKKYSISSSLQIFLDYDIVGLESKAFVLDNYDCFTNICYTPSMSAIMFERDDTTDGSIVLRTTCRDDEQMGSKTIRCLDSYWYLDPDPYSGFQFDSACISSSCYRVGSDYTAHYKGHLNKAYSGLSCLKWTNLTDLVDPVYDYQVPYYDGSYVSDLYDYCRDLHNTAAPSCFVVPTPGVTALEPCDVPLCEWTP